MEQSEIHKEDSFSMTSSNELESKSRWFEKMSRNWLKIAQAVLLLVWAFLGTPLTVVFLTLYINSIVTLAHDPSAWSDSQWPVFLGATFLLGASLVFTLYTYFRLCLFWSKSKFIRKGEGSPGNFAKAITSFTNKTANLLVMCDKIVSHLPMKRGEHYSDLWWKCERCGSPMRQEWPKRHFKGKIVCKFCYGILKERAKQEKVGIGA